MRAKKRAKVEAAVEKMLGKPEFVSLSYFDKQATSRLIICHGMMTVENYREMPNRWYRFWYKALLGWKWEQINDRRS